MRRHEPYEFDALATYNAEVARGIAHTPEWVERMRREQECFYARIVRGGGFVLTTADPSGSAPDSASDASPQSPA